jgi:chloramphenicol-sensitive protein RarD
MSEPPPSSRHGLLYGLAAYGIWGVFPLFINALSLAADRQITAEEVLAQRIVWSVAFLVIVLTLSRRWPMVATCLRVPTLRWTLVATAILIAANWYVYIYGITSRQTLQTSLGYFINPLVNVLLGMIYFRERLRRLQWVAIALAACGVAGMTMQAGEIPWIALGLAGCFSVYGLLRKKVPVDGLVGMSVETFLMVPAAAAYLMWLANKGEIALTNYGPVADTLIVLSGVATALPLICFGQAVRRLPLSTMGFLQYLAPTLQFLCAVVVLDEPLDQMKLVCFIWIWCGLAVYSVDSLIVLRNRNLVTRSAARRG